MKASFTVDHQRKGFVKRALKKREAKIVESVKTAMIVRGQKTSQTIKEVLTDVSKLKAPNFVKYTKKNPVRPFDDPTGLEFFAAKSDASLFILGSHSSKRPDNFVFGRFFNHRMLDMVEFGVENFKSMQSFKKESKQNIASRTCVLFQGEEFENDPNFKQIANILLDFFAEQPTEYINLACLDHILIFTSQPNKVLMRHYSVVLKKSGSRIPRIELSEIGPSIDFTLRRTRFASDDLREQALAHHVEKKSKGKKNVKRDLLHQELGTIHVGSQNLHQIERKLPKALRGRGDKRQRPEDAQDDETGEESVVLSKKSKVH